MQVLSVSKTHHSKWTAHTINIINSNICAIFVLNWGKIGNNCRNIITHTHDDYYSRALWAHSTSNKRQKFVFHVLCIHDFLDEKSPFNFGIAYVCKSEFWIKQIAHISFCCSFSLGAMQSPIYFVVAMESNAMRCDDNGYSFISSNKTEHCLYLNWVYQNTQRESSK